MKFPIDILKLIYEKKINLKKAEEIENFWRNYHTPRTLDVYEKGLMLSHAENNAFSIRHIRQLARWRYEGWPKKCPLCKRKLVIERYGWMNKKIGNRRKLAHIDCSDDYLRMLGYTPVEMGYANTAKVKRVTRNEMKKLKEKFKYVFWNQLEEITEKDIQKLKKK